MATAGVITALSIAERSLGFLYRIVLSRLIGAEGMGIYQVALSLFAVFLTLGTGGIPVTVSRFISKSKAENFPLGEKQATSAGLLASLLLTLPPLVFFLIFAEKCTFLFSDPRCVPVFRILLTGLVCSSIFAVIRGSFWGNKNFFLPAVLELAEEAVMVIAGVLLLQNITDPLSGAKGAAIAVVISYGFSFLCSVFAFFYNDGRLANPKATLKPLLSSTAPITAVRASGTLTNSAVAVLMPAMLIRAGYQSADALTLFGVLTGMVVPVLMIPSTVIGSISLALVPELSEDFYGKRKERLYKNIRRGLRTAFLVACFLLPVFASLGEDGGRIAFSNAAAGALIATGCPILLPMCLAMISTGILNSMGHEKQTLVYYFFGAAAFLLCVLFLPKLCGGYAYIAGLGASFLVCAVCNLLLLCKKHPDLFTPRENEYFRKEVTAFLSILPSSLVGKGFCVLFKRFLGELLALCCSGIALCLTIGICWCALGIIPLHRPAVTRKKVTA